MEQHDHPSPDMPGQVHVDSGTPGQWLSVTEAVAYCARHGLNRNIKTIRRWAERSLKRPDVADVRVREQDTGFGFRYMIERRSLDLKIRQELDFEAKQAMADTSGPYRTRPDMPAPAPPENDEENRDRPSSDMPGPAQERPEEPERKLEVQDGGDQFLKSQITEKDRQITQLNNQLERKDEQIMTMLERDRETNILIRGLQDVIGNALRLDAPTRAQEPTQRFADRPAGDNQPGHESRPGV